MKRAILSVMFFLISLLPAQVPRIMNYQGKLTDPDGVGLNGTYNMTFRIYNSPTGGTLLWEELHSLVNPVTVTNGLFDVVLGEMSPLNIAFDDTYWLEIQIGSEILTPRRKLTVVPYAFRAQVSDSVPYGAVWTGEPTQIAYGTPAGFLDGTDSLQWSGGALWINGYLRASGSAYPVARVTKTGSASAATEACLDLLLTYPSGDMQDNFGTGITMSVQDINEGPIRISGIYATRETSDSTGKLLFFTRGPEDTQWNTKMVIDRAGFVGIGTNTPNNLLEVAGGSDASETDLLQLRSKFPSANTATTLKFVNSNTQNTDFGAAEISASRDAPGNCDLIFRASDGGTMKEHMRITGDNGNVGIGTNSPNVRLEVNSGTINESGLKFTQLTSASPAGSPTTKVLSVDASGNVILVRDSIGTGAAGTDQWEDAGTYKRPTNPTNDNIRVYESPASGGIYASASGGYAFQGLYTGGAGATVEGRVAAPGIGIYGQVINTGTTGSYYAINANAAGAGSGTNQNFGILSRSSDGDANFGICATNHPTASPSEFTPSNGDYAGVFNWRVRITDQRFETQYPTLELADSVSGGSLNVRGIRLNGTNLQYQDAGGAWQNFGAGGGGTPAPPDQSIQFNNSGVFGGNTNFLFDNTNVRMRVGTAWYLARVCANGDNATPGAFYGVAGFGGPAVTGAQGNNGSADSQDGAGVYGYGSGGDYAYGVFGRAMGTGTNYGVYGRCNSGGITNYGVYGYVTAGTTRYGVYGEATGGGTTAYGIYGIASGATNNYGVYGQGTQEGVRGYTTGTSGGERGVFGQASGTGSGNVGVYGYNDATGAGDKVGILGNSVGANGTKYGVQGLASGTGTNYGVYGDVGGNPGYGVYGRYDGNRYGYLGDLYDGVFGRTNQNLGLGIGGRNTDTYGTGCSAGGNNVSTLPALVAGSGGAFRGTQFGCFADQTSSLSTPRAAFIGHYYDGGGVLREVRVGYYDGLNTYKISGTGLVSTIMTTRDGDKHLFAPEGTESWLFDMGEAKLQNGKCHVELDPLFLDCITVNPENPLKVFVQGAEGTLGAIRVTRGEKWFELEDTGGPSNGTVIYQVYGKWKGMEGKRLSPATEIQKVIEIKRD